ncbi:MAG: hypothetical protein CSB55_07105 [Candidatus Cloacimonadota bacterium]|nr:MAG: hypothetical protein CSB55_07105 [Candidatus Cloacimonadota bacterium]
MDYKKLSTYGFFINLTLSLILSVAAAVTAKVSLFQLSNSAYWFIPLFGAVVYWGNLTGKRLFPYIMIPFFSLTAFLVFETSELGGVVNSVIYMITFVAFVFAFNWLWYNVSMKILRSVKFSLITSTVFTGAEFLFMNILNKSVNSAFALNKFLDYFIIFLMFSLSVIITDIMILKLAKKYNIYDFFEEEDVDTDDD